MYAQEYQSSINNDKFDKFESKWMDLKIIMLSEINQMQKVYN